MTVGDNFKAGYIAITGQPNVGKSTLLNKLLDFKLSIISPRPQTTRRRIMGIMNKPGFQIIFLDTPGIIEPKYELQKAMFIQIQRAVSDADFLIFITDAQTKNDDAYSVQEEIELLKAINNPAKPVLLVLNKIDLCTKGNLLPLIDKWRQLYSFESIIPVSALTGDGLEQMEKEMIKLLPFHPPFYDPEVLTEQPERFFVAEFIREQIFLRFSQEIPYCSEIQIEDFKERENGKYYISATIYTERESQKAILIGKGGSALKSIGSTSRKQIEEFLDHEVYLDLHVKVRKSWRKDENQVRRFGYYE